MCHVLMHLGSACQASLHDGVRRGREALQQGGCLVLVHSLLDFSCCNPRMLKQHMERVSAGCHQDAVALSDAATADAKAVVEMVLAAAEPSAQQAMPRALINAACNGALAVVGERTALLRHCCTVAFVDTYGQI